MYFNSTSEQGQMLMTFSNSADAQDIIILELFQDNPDRALTAWEALNLLESKGYKYLITSVRRAITTLTKQGLLINTGIKKVELYNRPNFKCQYNG